MSKDGRGKAGMGESITIRGMRKYAPSMKVPGDGKVETPLKRFDNLGGARSAAHFADAMSSIGGRAVPVDSQYKGKK